MYAAKQNKEKVSRRIVSAVSSEVRQREKKDIYQFNLGKIGSMLKGNFSELNYMGGNIGMINNALSLLYSGPDLQQSDVSKIITLLYTIYKNEYITYNSYVRIWELCQNDLTEESVFGDIFNIVEDITNQLDSLNVEQKKKLQNDKEISNAIISINIPGNCGKLADFLFEKTGQKIDHGKAKKAIAKTANDSKVTSLLNEISPMDNDKVKVIYVASTIGHAFTMFIYDSNVEIIQSWQGIYNVNEWLEKNNNVWEINQFKDKIRILENIENNDYKSTLKEIFFINEDNIKKKTFGVEYYVCKIIQKSTLNINNFIYSSDI